eukprot:TRINITY_DN61260_c0_g2_i1.p1 TRINITY_DN61260_c0_g2~~TRINITY_DN61260_c0_g2_i1.p1  ORF type:complete len:175 (-),score=7.57 TRINITY_DN61260_c0_g2_i1:371-895(-)
MTRVNELSELNVRHYHTLRFAFKEICTDITRRLRTYTKNNKKWTQACEWAEQVNSLQEPNMLVNLDVGGTELHTTVHTLTKKGDCLFTGWFSTGGWDWKDDIQEDGYLLLDRDGECFTEILTWLRWEGECCAPDEHHYRCCCDCWKGFTNKKVNDMWAANMHRELTGTGNKSPP